MLGSSCSVVAWHLSLPAPYPSTVGNRKIKSHSAENYKILQICWKWGKIWICQADILNSQVMGSNLKKIEQIVFDCRQSHHLYGGHFSCSRFFGGGTSWWLAPPGGDLSTQVDPGDHPPDNDTNKWFSTHSSYLRQLISWWSGPPNRLLILKNFMRNMNAFNQLDLIKASSGLWT